MKLGEQVRVRAYGGKELVRVVVRLDKDTVVVCRQEEYEDARLEGREPMGVGFHLKDVISKGGEKPSHTTITVE